MDSSIKKKLILPLIIFVGMMIVNTNSIISGVEQHQTSRIVVASASSVLMLGAVIFILIRMSKIKKGNSPGNK